jgi:serine protease AprX
MTEPTTPPPPPDPNDRFREIQREMMRSILIEPLLTQVSTRPEDSYDVIIALNEFYTGGVQGARRAVEKALKALAGEAAETPKGERPRRSRSRTSLYVFATLTGSQILKLVEEQSTRLRAATVAARTRKTPQRLASARTSSPIYRIWEDSDVSVTLTKSVATVKADAAHRAFCAYGAGIVWAVLDSGIEGTHPHFTWKAPATRTTGEILSMETLDLPAPLEHQDFTPVGAGEAPDPAARACIDRLGHGTHVAGIIAGYYEAAGATAEPVIGTQVLAEKPEMVDTENAVYMRDTLTRISGIAPKCKLVSMKVIADVDDPATKRRAGKGKVSWIIDALHTIQEINEFGRRTRIHGVNLSVGYDFNPRWFGCGQSPICVEVDRLVKSGVSVVVAAGNGGYSSFLDAAGVKQSGFDMLNISDPGNAELAITVGSTHRDMPHTYGISYFSSRGPTGDGRLKPDLVAPGERIISCAAGAEQQKYARELARVDTAAGATDGKPVLYCEMSGTSMAAPHVSGAIAAFLSVRGEFIGRPERVKDIFLNSTIDLKRERYFQGTGLVDLMRALHSV